MSATATLHADRVRDQKRDALPSEVARLRFDAGLTLKEVSDATGLAVTTIYTVESRTHRPRNHVRAALARFYGIDESRIWP